jgi:hypothetical protein
MALITYTVMAPLVGGLIDRFGPRRVIVPEILVLTLGLMLYDTSPRRLANTPIERPGMNHAIKHVWTPRTGGLGPTGPLGRPHALGISGPRCKNHRYPRYPHRSIS